MAEQEKMNSTPKVSILLPNLNNRRYLDERIDCILNQTFTDWELVIVDNYSDDGAWEFFRNCRIRLQSTNFTSPEKWDVRKLEQLH